MSTEKRLNRLGLSHLADKPKELEKALHERIDVIEKKNKSWLNRKGLTNVEKGNIQV